MATSATDSMDVEMGPTRIETFENFVATSSGETSTSAYPAATLPFPISANATSSTRAAGGFKQPDETRMATPAEVTQFPKGFLRFISQQAAGHNGSIHRRLETEGELLISHWGYKAIFAAQRLYQWYNKHPEAARCPPGRFGEDIEPADLDEYNNLVEDLEQSWLRCHRLKMAQKEERTLLDVHPEEVRGIYRFLASQDMTGDDAFLPAYAPIEDFCTTALQQKHLPIRYIVYLPAVQKVLRKVQERYPALRCSDDSDGFLLSIRALSLVLEIFQIFFSSGLILVPIGIVLFGGLDKRAMFGVVVAFVFLFCTVVVLGRGTGACVASRPNLHPPLSNHLLTGSHAAAS